MGHTILNRHPVPFLKDGTKSSPLASLEQLATESIGRDEVRKKIVYSLKMLIREMREKEKPRWVPSEVNFCTNNFVMTPGNEPRAEAL